MPNVTFKRIVYQNDEGKVAVIIPCDCGLTIKQIADKDVPTGKPYAIINASDIPVDRTERGGWTVDADDLKDGVGA